MYIANVASLRLSTFIVPNGLGSITVSNRLHPLVSDEFNFVYVVTGVKGLDILRMLGARLPLKKYDKATLMSKTILKSMVKK